MRIVAGLVTSKGGPSRSAAGGGCCSTLGARHLGTHSRASAAAAGGSAAAARGGAAGWLGVLAYMLTTGVGSKSWLGWQRTNKTLSWPRRCSPARPACPPCLPAARDELCACAAPLIPKGALVKATVLEEELQRVLQRVQQQESKQLMAAEQQQQQVGHILGCSASVPTATSGSTSCQSTELAAIHLLVVDANNTWHYSVTLSQADKALLRKQMQIGQVSCLAACAA